MSRLVDIELTLNHSLDESGETPFAQRTLAVTYDTELRCVVGDGVLYTRDRVGYSLSNAVTVLLLEGLPGNSKRCWLPEHVRERCDRAADAVIATEEGSKVA